MPISSQTTRPYSHLLAAARGLSPPSREHAMQWFADAAWDALHPTGVSWIGFYLIVPAKAEMALGPRRDKPACSPIGLHGACGQAFVGGKTLIVTDVAKLGAGYIACDPRDKSEVVIPVFEPDGTSWGVLDADSYDTDSFGQNDANQLWSILAAAKLTSALIRPETRII